MQPVAQAEELLFMIFNVMEIVKNNGIISPDHLTAANPFTQRLKGIYNLIFFPQPPLHVSPYGVSVN